MKKVIYLMFLFCLQILISCKSNNPNEPENEYFGQDLLTQLSHYKYSLPGYYLEFFPDGTFIQKVSSDEINNDGELVEEYERTGKYALEDSLIILSEVKVTFNKSLLSNGGISIIWSDQIAYIKDGLISLRPVTVLQGKENTVELWNYWETIKWTYHYVNEEQKEYSGRQLYFYEFTKNESKVRYGWDYIDGKPWPPREYESGYSYNPPYLHLNGPAENYEILFNNNKMYWYRKSLLNKSIINSKSIRPLDHEKILLF